MVRALHVSFKDYTNSCLFVIEYKPEFTRVFGWRLAAKSLADVIDGSRPKK